jgi:hypothetical protein
MRLVVCVDLARSPAVGWWNQAFLRCEPLIMRSAGPVMGLRRGETPEQVRNAMRKARDWEYGRVALRVATAPTGVRNNILNTAAFRLGAIGRRRRAGPRRCRTGTPGGR